MGRAGVIYRRVRRTVLARRRLLAALAAAGAVAAGLQAASAPPQPTTTVLTAARDLPAGSVLDAADLTETEFAPDSVPTGTLRSAGAAVGRTTAGPVRAGEPLTDVRLLSGSLLAGYPGSVAVPVRIGDPGAVALLRVGDRVEIVAADPQGRRPAELVASRVPVVAIPRRSTSSPGMVTGGLIVVATTEETAQRLAQAGVAAFLSVVLDR
jgi:Flp pilus assembly protein CpaB